MGEGIEAFWKEYENVHPYPAAPIRPSLETQIIAPMKVGNALMIGRIAFSQARAGGTPSRISETA
eukprot:CAMPEP_0180313800 /NCGR_PEP_ID=MMETSP0988-20121125/31651_1 /TAXON_ID=697907 /ORGANISM="non described non described, Strain CCMP2293" /LENGTH=64 /DNA_ID=CAMNT_0022298321 /DNA_START=183 /DNA_END=377 /DNA_ORIENTATION=+